MPNPLIVNTGEKYNLLTIVEEVYAQSAPNGIRRRRFLCKCKCGNTSRVVLGMLRSGRVKSCGCLKAKSNRDRNFMHGESKSHEHNCWRGMISRTTNSNVKEYHNYGGRGIYVCMRWRTDFMNFLADMGRKPTGQHTIERIDNEMGYCWWNCKWATRREQAMNRRTNLSYESSK